MKNGDFVSIMRKNIHGYTKKAYILDHLLINNPKIIDVSNRTGIHQSTLYRWKAASGAAKAYSNRSDESTIIKYLEIIARHSNRDVISFADIDQILNKVLSVKITRSVTNRIIRKLFRKEIAAAENLLEKKK